MKTLFIVAISCLSSLASVTCVFGQDFQYTTVEPELNAQCVDTPPVGDGFGWNGRCGCTVETEWSNFGSVVAVEGNIAAILAEDTPENCPGSDATISIYEQSASDNWNKVTEFQVSDVEHGSANSMTFVNGNLVVDMHLEGVNIYQQSNNGEWPLVSNLSGAPGPFVAWRYANPTTTVTFADRDLNGNVTVQSVLQVEDRRMSISRFGDIAVGQNDSELFFFSENLSGHWQLDTEIPLTVAQGIIVVNDAIITIDDVDNMHIWTRDTNGAWNATEYYITNIPQDYFYLTAVPFESNGRLLLTTPGRFRTYAQTNGIDWIETDRLDLPGGQWSGIWNTGGFLNGFHFTTAIRKNVAFNGNHLLAGNESENVVYALNVSSDGIIGGTSVLAETATDCDYSNSAIYNGWGWNAITGQSCAPVDEEQILDCDYSNADSFDGWGWNPITRTSCAPISNTAVESTISTVNNASACDYSNSMQHGGWGWNNMAGESCPPLTDQSCDYSDALLNHGWGWNSVTGVSCPPR